MKCESSKFSCENRVARKSVRKDMESETFLSGMRSYVNCVSIPTNIARVCEVLRRFVRGSRGATFGKMSNYCPLNVPLMSP